MWMGRRMAGCARPDGDLLEIPVTSWSGRTKGGSEVPFSCRGGERKLIAALAASMRQLGFPLALRARLRHVRRGRLGCMGRRLTRVFPRLPRLPEHQPEGDADGGAEHGHRGGDVEPEPEGHVHLLSWTADRRMTLVVTGATGRFA